MFHEKQLCRLLMVYAVYFNHARPHQGIQQQIPALPVLSAPPEPAEPGDRRSGVGWVIPRLPKSGLNHRRRKHQAEVAFD